MLEPLLELLQNMPPACVGGIMLIFAYIVLGVFDRLFGALGVCAYGIIVALVANIQVLKWVKFIFLPHPIAMGTAIFSTLFLASDLMVEKYGLDWGKRSVGLIFFVQGVFSIFMLLTLGITGVEETFPIQGALKLIFLPSFQLWIAGLLAFFASQFLDIFVYQLVKNLSSSRFLWLRAGVAYALAALCDNLLFSLLAWRWLAAEPVAWDVLWQTYIFGGYGLRLVFGLMNVGVLYIYCR